MADPRVEVVHLVASVLPIVAAFQFVDALSEVAGGILRAMEKQVGQGQHEVTFDKVPQHRLTATWCDTQYKASTKELVVYLNFEVIKVHII